MSRAGENMHETSNLIFYPLTDWLLGTAIGNHGHSMIDLQL